MGTKTNTLAVNVVAKDKASKPLGEVSKSIQGVGRGAEHLGDFLPQAAGRGSQALSGLSVAAGATAAGAAAAAAAVVGVGFAAVEASQQVFGLAERSAELGDQAFVTADRLNVTTEFFTGLAAAGNKLRVSTDDLESAFGDLTQRAVNMPKDFERWGIATRDANGELKTTEELARSVADRMAQASSETEQFALADELMSDAGRRLVPILREGADGLDRLIETSVAAGTAISESSAIIAHEFTTELKAAEGVMDAVSREAGSVFQPALTKAFGVVQDVAGDVLSVIVENRDEFEAFATKSVALMARGFALLVDTGSAASVVLEGLVSIVSFGMSDAFSGARRIASDVSDAARDLADELEHGADVTSEDVVPAVNAENRARKDLLSTLISEGKERKNLIELTEEATFDLAEAEVTLRGEIEKTAKAGELAALVQARTRKAEAEERARTDLEVAQQIEAQTRQSAQTVAALEKKLAAQRAAIRGEDVQQALQSTEVVVDRRGRLIQDEMQARLALLDKESGARRVSALEVANAEVEATRKALAAAKRAHAERIEDLGEAKAGVEESTDVFIKAKQAEIQAEEEFERARDRAQRAEERRQKKAARDRSKAIKAAQAAEEQQIESAVSTAQTIAGAAQRSTNAIISVFRTAKQEGASTGDVLLQLGEVFVQTSTQAITAMQQQAMQKQTAAATEISADAAAAGANVGKSVSEELPWFVALAVAPAVMATMFGLVKAFAGKFHQGGDIPGPLGSEQFALVQGGERIQSIDEVRRERRDDRGGRGRGPAMVVKIESQSLVPLQARSDYERTYRGPLRKSLQRLKDQNQARDKRHSRLSGRRRAA